MDRETNTSQARPLLLVLTALAVPLVAWGATGLGDPVVDTSLGRVDPPLGKRARQKQRLLAKIPGDPSALVNVRIEHLPATGDLTLLGKDPRAIQPLLFCFSQGTCSGDDLARGLQDMPSWRATAPLVLGYSRRAGRYGWGQPRLLRAVGKRKLRPGHRSTLRSVLTAGKWKPALRRPLLRLLGRLRDRSARAAYWAFSKSREPLTRMNAAYALANQGYAQGRKYLITALTQSAPRIKRGAADLLRSLTHKPARAAAYKELTGALKGHGPFTRLAAAYALTGWDAKAGIAILTGALEGPSRRQRNEAAYYLMRTELRPHRALIAKAAKAAKTPALRGSLTRILRVITPGTVKTSVFDWVNL